MFLVLLQAFYVGTRVSRELRALDPMHMPQAYLAKRGDGSFTRLEAERLLQTSPRVANSESVAQCA